MPESAKETPAPIESKPVLVSLSSPPLALETIAIGEKCFGFGYMTRPNIDGNLSHWTCNASDFRYQSTKNVINL